MACPGSFSSRREAPLLQVRRSIQTRWDVLHPVGKMKLTSIFAGFYLDIVPDPQIC